MAVNERETQKPLYPRNHPYSPGSGVGTPDEQDLLQAEVLELRGRTARAELRVEVLTRLLKEWCAGQVPGVGRTGLLFRSRDVLERGGP